MTFIVILFMIIASLITYGLYRLLTVVKQNNVDHTVAFLMRFSIVVFTGLIIMQALGVILYALEISASETYFVLFVKIAIQIVLFVYLFKDLKRLLFNLKENIVFDSSNIDLTSSMGTLLIYLTLSEILAGLVLGVFFFFGNGSFYLTTNPTIILYIFLGLTLFIVSQLLDKAKTLYEENKLTI